MAERTKPDRGRNEFVPPELTPCPEAVREALATIAAAVTSRSAEIQAGYQSAPGRKFIEAWCDTSSACDDLKGLARFFDVEAPFAGDASFAWRRPLPS